MTIVVDASVGLKWVLDEDETELAIRLLNSGQALAVPDFWLNEATSVLWLRVRRTLLSADQARHGLRLLREACTPVPTTRLGLPEIALEIGVSVGHSPHDTLYAAFALAIGASRIVAADAGFIAALRRHPDATIASLPVTLSELGLAAASGGA